MLRRLLSIVLAATVFACPFLCRIGAKIGAQVAGSSACCGCCHDHGPQAPGDHSTPSNEHKGSHGCCQCICGGAVLDASPAPVGDVDLSCWAPLPVAEASASRAIAARLNASGAVLQPDDGMNPGRALRCLFMSYLC